LIAGTAGNRLPLGIHLAVRFVRPEGTLPKWTARTQEEWICNFLADRPDLKPEQLARTAALMETSGRDWEVPDYAGLLRQPHLQRRV